jgi:transposase-like protein
MNASIISPSQSKQAITLYSTGVSIELISIVMQVSESQLIRGISKYITV